MGIQDIEIAPDSFGDAFKDNYLGNPVAVAALVAQFCAATEALVNDLMFGRADKSAFEASLNGKIREQAAIFAGRNPDYITIKGYNEHTLGYKLMADMGELWSTHRSKWDENDENLAAVCVLFEWLAVMVAENIKVADGDEMLLGVMLKPSVQWATRELLGIEART